MLPETSMSAWIPALHAGMTELRSPCVHLSETPLVNDAIFSKELTKALSIVVQSGWDIFALNFALFVLLSLKVFAVCANVLMAILIVLVQQRTHRRGAENAELRVLITKNSELCVLGVSVVKIIFSFCLRLCRPTSAPGRAPLPKPVQEKISPGRPLFSLPSPIWQPQAAPRHPLLQRQ